MSFLLDTLENMLKLSPSEKATVATASPTLLKWVTMLNAQWATIEDLLHWLFRSQPVVDRLVADGKTLGPIVQDMLSDTDSLFEVGPALAAVNDVKAIGAANPALIKALTGDYNKLVPLINQVQGDVQKPEIKAALALLQSKMSAQGVKAHQVLERVVKEHLSGATKTAH